MSTVFIASVVLPSAADVDHRDRRGRRDRGLEADRDAAAAPLDAAAAVERRAPVHSCGQRIEHALDRGVAHHRAARMGAAVAQDVLAAELDRVDAERARDQVGVALVGPHQLRDAEAAQRAGRRAVGVELEGIDADVLDVVGTGGGEAGLLRDARADVRIGAAVPQHVALARDDAAVLADAALDAERGRMLGQRDELFLHRQRDLHGPAHDQRQRRDQGLELDIDLGAEPAAEMRHLHPHPVLRPFQQARDLAPHERRHLRGGVDGQPVVAGIGQRDERLQRQMQHRLGAEGVLEHVIGRGQRRLGVAEAQVIVERDIGAAPAGEMLEVGKRAGGLQHVVDDDLAVERLDLVVDRRQFVVLGLDQAQRLFGDMRIGGQHHRDRLADVADLFQRQDRLVVERRAVIRIGNEPDEYRRR